MVVQAGQQVEGVQGSQKAGSGGLGSDMAGWHWLVWSDWGEGHQVGEGCLELLGQVGQVLLPWLAVTGQWTVNV